MEIMLVLVRTNLLANSVTATVSYPSHLLAWMMVSKTNQAAESNQILSGPYLLWVSRSLNYI
jgi:hypothetical protein